MKTDGAVTPHPAEFFNTERVAKYGASLNLHTRASITVHVDACVHMQMDQAARHIKRIQNVSIDFTC